MSASSAYRLNRGAHRPDVGRTVWASIRAGLVGLIGALARERELRRSMRALASFDDRMLRDIGLTRSDIERAVRSGRS